MSFLKIFAIFSLIGDWYKRAMADGEVTLKEGVELIISLGGLIGLTIAPEVMAVVAETATDVLDAVEDSIETVRDAVDEVADEALEGPKAVAVTGIEAELIAKTTKQ